VHSRVTQFSHSARILGILEEFLACLVTDAYLQDRLLRKPLRSIVSPECSLPKAACQMPIVRMAAMGYKAEIKPSFALIEIRLAASAHIAVIQNAEIQHREWRQPAVISTGRRNTLSRSQKMACMLENQWNYRGFTTAEKAELWDRWKLAGARKSIARAIREPSSSVYHQLAWHEGIKTPAEKINASVASTGW